MVAGLFAYVKSWGVNGSGAGVGGCDERDACDLATAAFWLGYLGCADL